MNKYNKINQSKSLRKKAIIKALKDAEMIVYRANLRKNKNLHFLPKRHNRKEKDIQDIDIIQEKKDADRLAKWRLALNGKGDSICTYEVMNYLDRELQGWRLKNLVIKINKEEIKYENYDLYNIFTLDNEA